MIHYALFGLIGPAATLLSLRLSIRGLLGWDSLWLAYVILLLPFLVSACVDRALLMARWWERMIVAAFLGFVLSGIAIAVAAALFFPRISLGNATMVLGFYAAIPAAVCSLLASTSKLPAPPPPRRKRQRPDWS